MNLWTMIFLIVTIVMIAEVIKTLARSNSKKPAADDGRMARLEERLKAVERRLENIETITTSKDFQLDREIEALSRQRE